MVVADIANRVGAFVVGIAKLGRGEITTSGDGVPAWTQSKEIPRLCQTQWSAAGPSFRKKRLELRVVLGRDGDATGLKKQGVSWQSGAGTVQ
jgi:hypothetical protein